MNRNSESSKSEKRNNFSENYKISTKLGDGSYGVVKLASKDDQEYAVKIISKKRLFRKQGFMPKGGKRPDILKQLYREIAILKKLNHQNIIKLIDVFDDSGSDNLYMVLELLQNGPIIEIPTENTLPQSKAKKYFFDVICGLNYMHFHGIIHGDIKNENLLLTINDRVKITDFSTSYEFNCDTLAPIGGTPEFMPPELYNTKNITNHPAIDIWAAGITLYIMIYGNTPFESDGVYTVMVEKITKCDIDYPHRKDESMEDLIDLLAKMFQKDEKDRLSIKQITQHKWLKDEKSPNRILENSEKIQVTEKEIDSSVKTTTNLHTLMFIKTVIKKKSFKNPYKKQNT
ncbi:hypothetical protein A3Q56_02833 [Intoshia linei]|uniref:Protein kinase domain-containing protein n=1 Tax=Intoshia linei TaxID=1819745 RepID=A0A177B751_9BILA|nr:hypothetical protein A3Q56_02833 [Intoshia linei]